MTLGFLVVDIFANACFRPPVLPQVVIHLLRNKDIPPGQILWMCNRKRFRWNLLLSFTFLICLVWNCYLRWTPFTSLRRRTCSSSFPCLFAKKESGVRALLVYWRFFGPFQESAMQCYQWLSFGVKSQGNMDARWLNSASSLVLQEIRIVWAIPVT